MAASLAMDTGVSLRVTHRGRTNIDHGVIHADLAKALAANGFYEISNGYIFTMEVVRHEPLEGRARSAA